MGQESADYLPGSPAHHHLLSFFLTNDYRFRLELCHLLCVLMDTCTGGGPTLRDDFCSLKCLSVLIEISLNTFKIYPVTVIAQDSG